MDLGSAPPAIDRETPVLSRRWSTLYGMSTTFDPKRTTIQVRLRSADAEKLRELAAAADEPVSAVVRRAIRLYMGQEEGDERAEHHGREGQA
jgi:Ribbon-helix-helix protein, copG family